MKLPRRATAGGTTRTPVAAISSGDRCANLVCTLSKKASSPDFISALSFRRNDSSTAFLIHWWTVHWPTPSRVATRRWPLFSSAMTCSTASATSFGAEAAESWARLSHAVSMICWSCWVMGCLTIAELDELDDAHGGFDALGRVGDERHPDAPLAGVGTIGFPGEVAARQDGHIVLSVELAGEFDVA